MPKLILLAQTNAGANSAIVTFIAYIVIVLFLAWLSSRVAQKGSFLSEYFLGGRDLGVWTFALTFAATSASGGSFIGFPSLVYTHGWSVALWISSYMLVPLVAMGLLAKRLNQIARKTDSITIPDLILERFQSPLLGLLSTVLIVFFTTFNLIAQFKGGSVILQTLLSDVPLFQEASFQFAKIAAWLPWITEGVEPSYLFCLCVFAVAVVAYTTYGGFRAVVWTDVLQGIVMVLGILILLPLTLVAVGGLRSSTVRLSDSKPPVQVQVALSVEGETERDSAPLPRGSTVTGLYRGKPISLRLTESAQINEFGRLVPIASSETGFDASPSIGALWFGDKSDGGERVEGLAAEEAHYQVDELVEQPFGYGSGQSRVYTTLPGPSEKSSDGFLPLAAAISFFFFWCFASAGQPSNMIRCMAFRDSRTLSKAIFTVAIYYSLIYFPIVIIFCCARTLLPGWENASDRIMPEMASTVTASFGVPWLAGLLVAAPFAAVMSTMDSFLLLVSSSVVRDIYVRWINPNPSERKTKALTYTTTLIVGVTAMVAAINPPQFLQDIIVFTGAGLATSFLVPVALALYWPRFNHQGAIAGMVLGFACNIALYAVGTYQAGQMAAYEPFGFSPFVMGLGTSLIASVAVCLLTPRPKQELVLKFFYRRIA